MCLKKGLGRWHCPVPSMYRFGFNNELVVHEDIDSFGTTSFTLDQGVYLVGLAVAIVTTYFKSS